MMVCLRLSMHRRAPTGIHSVMLTAVNCSASLGWKGQLQPDEVLQSLARRLFATLTKGESKMWLQPEAEES